MGIAGMDFDGALSKLSKRQLTTRAAWNGEAYLYSAEDGKIMKLEKVNDRYVTVGIWTPNMEDLGAEDWEGSEFHYFNKEDNYLPFGLTE